MFVYGICVFVWSVYVCSVCVSLCAWHLFVYIWHLCVCGICVHGIIWRYQRGEGTIALSQGLPCILDFWFLISWVLKPTCPVAVITGEEWVPNMRYLRLTCQQFLEL